MEESQHSVKQNRLRLWNQDSIIQANSRNKHSSHTEITIIRKGAQHTRTDQKKPSLEENITQGVTINAPRLLSTKEQLKRAQNIL